MSFEHGDQVVTCCWVENRLALLPSGDLPRDERGLCFEHLKHCHSCRREFGINFGLRKKLKALRPEATAVPLAAQDEHFFTDLRRDVLDRIANECEPLAAAAVRALRRRWAVSAAVAGVLFATGLHLGRDGDVDPLFPHGEVESPLRRTPQHGSEFTGPVGLPDTLYGPWEGFREITELRISGAELVLGRDARRAVIEALMMYEPFDVEDTKAFAEAARRDAESK